MTNDTKDEPAVEVVEKKPRNHLQYVSWAFIFIGALALIQTAQSFVNDPTPVPDFLIVFIIVGWGLLKRKSLWRTFALSCSYVFFIFTLGNVLMIITGNKSLAMLPTFDIVMFWVRSILMLAAGGYAIWALQTKSVREQFDSKL